MVGGATEAGIQSKKLTDHIFNHKHQVERENWVGCSAMISQAQHGGYFLQQPHKELHQPETKYSNIGAYRRQIFIQSITNTLHNTLLYRNCQTICETMENWINWPNKFESLGLLQNIPAYEKTVGINPSMPFRKIESKTKSKCTSNKLPFPILYSNQHYFKNCHQCFQVSGTTPTHWLLITMVWRK